MKLMYDSFPPGIEQEIKFLKQSNSLNEFNLINTIIKLKYK